MSDIAQRLAALSPEQREMLARRLKEKGAIPQTPTTVSPNGSTRPIPRVPRDGTLPLSLAQQRLWFLAQLEPDSPFYNVHAAYRLSGTLDASALERSLNAIVERHEVLRANVVEDAGTPSLVITPERLLQIPQADLSELPEDTREAEALRLAALDASQPFNLASGSLLRCRLFRLSATEHVLLLVMHHIICDEWSVGILFRELTELYTAFTTGQSVSLPELPIQYADFAVWQRKALQGPEIDTQLAYWKRQLTGLPASLDLPTDRSRPAAQTFNGADHTFIVPAQLMAQLQTLSQHEGVTLFMTLLTAWQALLARYARQDDIAVGVPIAGRSHADIEGVIGFFVNTLVFRTDLSGNPSFRELLKRVREVALGAYSHQDLPFEKLVDTIQPERDPSRNPLFQVAFMFDQAMTPPLKLPDLRIRPLTIDRGTAKFDITLALYEIDQSLNGVLEYNTTLFDAATIARLGEHFQVLLRAMVANPDQRISHVSLVAEAELKQLLEEWNATTSTYPREASIHELAAQQAAQSPNSIAVVFDQTSITYGELDRRANQLAQHLQTLGVGPDVLVGVCLERSIDLVVALLAILKAGGAYVPLDPVFPRERLAFILHDTEATVLLTETQFEEMLVQAASNQEEQPALQTIIRLDIDWPLIAQASADAPVNHATPDNLAYVMYTSGSTGRPKGIGIPHRAVTRLVCDTDYVQINATDHVAQAANAAFDAATFEIWGTLLNGARLIGITKDVALSPREFAAQIQEHQVTILFLTTALFNALAREVPGVFRSVRALLFGGEAVDPHWVRQVLQHQPPQRLLHVYGPTENTTFSTWYHVEDAPATITTVPIGRPIANTQMYVLDAHWQPVPIGVPGELYLGGDGLARGYIHRPRVTAEHFIPNPFSQQPGERLYKTGDLVRYSADGQLEFVGRVDHQVKIRGFRIELGEIETLLAQHPALQEVVVMVRHDTPSKKWLVAYVVARPGEHPAVNQIRHFLKERLPDYMIPGAFVILDAFPVNPNGKIDRKALPAPEQSRPVEDHSLVGSRTPAEELLTAIWKQVLGVEQVGVHDNFFALGGDSILGIQIVARANQANLRITPRQIFQYQTIAELAAVAQAVVAQAATQDLVTGPVPLTPIQRWFFAWNLPEPQHFNQAVMLTPREPLDSAVLEQAFQHVIAHHDALRLRFTTTESGWQQINAGLDTQTVVTLVDLSDTPSEQRAAALEAAATQTQASLSLSQGPLVRAALFNLGAGEPGRLLLAIHHLAVDAVSWPIIIADLETAYTQLHQCTSVALPAKSTAFKQWAERLVSYAQTDALQQEIDYWRTLAQHQPASLPLDKPNGENTLGSEREVVVTLSVEDTHILLHDVPDIYHTQINDVLLTALAHTFAPWTGDAALLVDLEGHGREDLFDDIDLTRTVGWFTSIFPALLDLRGIDDPGMALKSIKESLRHVPHHGLGYGVLRYLSENEELVAPLRTMARPSISFNYLGQSDHDLAEDGLFALASESVGSLHGSGGLRRHVLEILGNVTQGQLQVRWMYSAALHHAVTIERLAEAYLDALRRLIAHCRQPGVGGYTPSDFPLAQLDQLTLDQLIGHDRTVEDIYPLSPMQQGLLFHSLYKAETGVYITQIFFTVQGTLNAALFQRAWEQIAERHTLFRTSFAWHGLAVPHQIVRRGVELPWRIADWRDLSPIEQEAQFKLFLDEERRQGFDLEHAPLMRMGLFQVADDRHQFVWTHHHLLLDGWSLSVILNEVFATYASIISDQETYLFRPRPYRDYIAWLQQQNMAQAEEFWRRALAGFTTPTPLGVDRLAAPGTHTVASAKQEHALSPTLTVALQKFCRSHELTLNTLVQGAWALLLSHYSGEQDVLFGTTISGRPADLPNVESMTGLFINTLPVRLQVSPQITIAEWLAQIQSQQAELREYEYSPLVQVQRWSDVPHDQQLFESIIVFENYPVDDSAADLSAGVTLENIGGVEQINYPLGLTAWLDMALMFRISYDAHRFDDATIARMIGHLEQILTGMIRQPQHSLGNLSLLTAAERQQLLAWNETAATYPQEMCFHERFMAQAAQTPDTIAVTYQQEQLTYAELDRRSNQLAHYLRSIGVGPEVLVGICLERSVELVVSILGIFKAGGAYLPLDPAYPAERLSYMLQDSKVSVLLSQERLAGNLPQHTAQVCYLDRAKELLRNQSALPPAWTTTPDNLAYMIYTSGSTGRPKGVLLHHRGLSNLAEAQAQTFKLQPGDRMLQFASLNFDASIFEIVMALGVGATICLADRTTLLPGPEMISFLRDRQISIVTLPPSVLAMLPETELPALHTITVAGEACPSELVARWAPGRRFFNLYGPTEATVWTTIEPSDPAERVQPIGRPILNTEVYLLDATLQPVPIGVTGEIYIGGVSVARGYQGRADLTAERFVPHIFSGQGERPLGARLYRTGDLARYRPDGTLEFMGRIDHQVKLRGHRIELGEIEAQLAKHPAVREALVLMQEDVPPTGGHQEQRLVAYLIEESTGTNDDRSAQGNGLSAEFSGVSPAELRGFLKEALPEYMIPAAFLALKSFPLTPNGKIDRRRLPTIDAARPQQAETFVAPRTDVEQTIAGIWQSVLRLQHVGVHDNFFDLGGHSLLMLQLHDALRQAFDKPISLVELFRHPSVSALATYFTEDQRGPSAGASVNRNDRAQKKIEALNRKSQLRKDKGTQ